VIVHLYSGSFLEGDQALSDGSNENLGGDSFLEKEAMLVYPGTFQSMDGEVVITDEHVSKLADTHNSFLSKVKRLATGEIPLRDCPPVQLDHQPTAVNTVGRVIGELSVRDAEVDGQSVKALFGKVRILGRENVEKVRDGRWIHLSIGADLEKGKLNELTITPFPAAAQAAMLGKRKLNDIDDDDLSVRFAKVEVRGHDADILYEAPKGYFVRWKDGSTEGPYDTLEEATQHIGTSDKKLSSGNDCKIYKASDGNWYLLLEVRRGAEMEPFGPFSSESELKSYLNRKFQNPGGYGYDASGTKPPPTGAKLSKMKNLCRLSKEVKYRNAVIITVEFADGKWQSYVPKEYLHGEPYFHGATEKDVIGMAKQAIDEYLSHTNQISFTGAKLDKPFAELTTDLSKTATLSTSVRLTERKVGAFTYKGYQISVYESQATRFGFLYLAEIDGEPWTNAKKYYQSKEAAIAAVKSEIDSEDAEMSAKLSSLQPDFSWGTKGRYEGEEWVSGRGVDQGKVALYDQSKGKWIVFDSIDELKTHVDNNKKLSEEDDMDKSKMKKHLMEKTQCSEEEADEKLAGMSPEECSSLASEADEAEKKLAADKEEADKKLAQEKAEPEEKKEEEKKAEMTARRTKVIALAKDFRTGITGVQLASKKSSIIARLSSLRGQAKITPAEIKKTFSEVQLTKLAAQSDDAIESVLKTYADREPVVDVQQYGSARAEDVAQIAQRIKSSELTKETLAGMEFTKKAHGSKLAEGPTEQPGNQPLAQMDDMPDFDAVMSDFSTEYASGKKEEALAALKEKMKKMRTRNMGDNIEQFPLAQDQEKQMSALAESVKRLQNQFEELLSMVSPEMGIGDADLK
jgi:hypothetical protein